MSAIGDCCRPCPPFIPPTNVPGPSGNAGSNGTNGVNSYSVIANFQGIGFVVPAVGSSATVYVTDTGAWMGLNQPVFITGAGQYLVTAEASTNANGTFVQLKNIGAPGNAVPGSSISAGNMISPSGLQGTNAYTVTTATYVTPAVGFSATITVANAAWMIVGETVFVQGGGYFNVVSVNAVNNTAVLSNPGFANTTAGATIPTGFGVGPSGTQGSLPLPLPQVSTQTGLSVALTTTMTAIAGASVTLPAAGTWLLIGVIRGTGTYSSAASASGLVEGQLNAQASGAGPFTQIPNSKAINGLPAVNSTSANAAAYNFVLPTVIYQTATVGDVIDFYAQYAVNGTSLTGAVVVEINLLAVCINLQT